MDVYDAYTADEAFITSTSWCICGVRTFNGRQIGESTEASPHGPITRRLMDAYVELVQCDFVKQYTDAH
jgi:branched-chain amino acid aminotransferase